MSFVQRLVHKPGSLAARGWIFQIHLWTGLIAAIYAIVIGVTGSALIFSPEIRDWQVRRMMAVNGSGPHVSADQILKNVREAYPGYRVSLIYLPPEETSTFRASISKGSSRRAVFLDPFSGKILGERIPTPDLLNWLDELHINLLTGKTGNVVNGVGGLALVLLSLTGIVIWWPGPAHVLRAIGINWKRRWKRINYDIHSAVGFATMWFVLALSISGAYFVWPRESKRLISNFSPIRNGVQIPTITAKPVGQLPLAALLEIASKAVPGSWLELIIFPGRNTQPIQIALMSGNRRAYGTVSNVYLNPSTGEILRVETPAQRTVGDSIVTWMSILHFASFGGLFVKFLWAVFGLAFAVLGASGVLMWWNRVAVKQVVRWRRARNRSLSTPEPDSREEARTY